MTGSGLRRTVEESWSALSSVQATGEHRLRVALVAVNTANGPVATALDHEGRRHVLVPVRSRQQIRRGLDGPVLRLRRRPLEDDENYQVYADLGCLRPEYDELFTRLCTDVLVEVEQVPENPLKALYRVLDRWKSLFDSPDVPLRPAQQAGLLGELLVLIRLLERDPSAHRLWLGPGGHRHDFGGPGGAIEVKASADDDGRHPRIHGLRQLESPLEGELRLVSLHVRRVTEAGTSLPDVVDRAVELCDDESSLLGLLAKAGYRTHDADLYRPVRFEPVEERWYRVDADFPKLTERQLVEAGVAVGSLDDVEYTIDLSGERPVPLGAEETSEILQRMLLAESA